MTITKPGLYADCADYHDDPCPAPSLSASIAKILLAKSPRHAWLNHPRLNPDFAETYEGKFDLGSTAHAMLLQGHDLCVTVCADDWRTKAAKDRRDEIRADGKIPLLMKHYDAVCAMVDEAKQAISECSDLSCITLADGKAEQTMAWQEGNIWCRAKVDWIANRRDLIIDYKTAAASAKPENWGRTMLGMGGEIQPAFYLRGNAATGGSERAHWVFLVQEVEEPYACSFVGLSPAYMNWANEKVTEAIRLWGACLTANDWPGYSTNRISYIDPPPWSQVEWAQRMADMQDAAPGDLPWE